MWRIWYNITPHNLLWNIGGIFSRDLLLQSSVWEMGQEAGCPLQVHRYKMWVHQGVRHWCYNQPNLLRFCLLFITIHYIFCTLYSESCHHACARIFCFNKSFLPPRVLIQRGHQMATSVLLLLPLVLGELTPMQPPWPAWRGRHSTPQPPTPSPAHLHQKLQVISTSCSKAVRSQTSQAACPF